jgi:hypothetical protein
LHAVTNGEILKDCRFILSLGDLLLDDRADFRHRRAIAVRAVVESRHAAAQAHYLVANRFKGWFLGAVRARHGSREQAKNKDN